MHGGKSTYMLQAATDVFVSFYCYIFPPQITAGKHRILSAGTEMEFVDLWKILAGSEREYANDANEQILKSKDCQMLSILPNLKVRKANLPSSVRETNRNWRHYFVPIMYLFLTALHQCLLMLYRISSSSYCRKQFKKAYSGVVPCFQIWEMKNITIILYVFFTISLTNSRFCTLSSPSGYFESKTRGLA